MPIVEIHCSIVFVASDRSAPAFGCVKAITRCRSISCTFILMWILFVQEVFTCCLSEHDAPIGNLNEMDLDECYNSDNMKSFRLDMLDNKKVSNCNRCYELEEVGHDTLRKRSNDEFIFEKYDLHEDKSHIVQETKEDGSLDDVHLKLIKEIIKS